MIVDDRISAGCTAIFSLVVEKGPLADSDAQLTKREKVNFELSDSLLSRADEQRG